jgi:hypothetical protein
LCTARTDSGDPFSYWQCEPSFFGDPGYYACGPNGEDPVTLPAGSACTYASASLCASGLQCDWALPQCLVPGCRNVACTLPCEDNYYSDVATSKCTSFQVLVGGYTTASCSGTPSGFVAPTPGCGTYGSAYGMSAAAESDANWNVRFCTDPGNDLTNWCVVELAPNINRPAPCLWLPQSLCAP